MAVWGGNDKECPEGPLYGRHIRNGHVPIHAELPTIATDAASYDLQQAQYSTGQMHHR